MRKILWIAAVTVFLLAAASAFSAEKAVPLTCVGLYSETDAGHVSYRVGKGEWVIIKVGDKVPANAEVRVNVDRDRIELIAASSPASVYEITGSETAEVTKSVAEILKMKPRVVSLPKGTKDKPDPKFKDKLVVTQWVGRQVSMTPDGDSKDIQYGDILGAADKVKIIGINNTITLMNASGAVTTVIGPLKFEVEKVLTNKTLYKYLNVQK